MLDADHYDIEKVKERILDHLAVRKLKPDARGSILSFVGPPGVGKTSLGKSIAKALGRKFERISVGGVRDEAEIRGHRRTYIGALPGTIIRALRDAESNNPVFMIDEIDKMGADFRGDPASAMLEVLDPEQNHSFRDHYLDLPFDLSNVMFITTANILETIPAPLRDRMEVIQLSGYTAEEKHEIATPLPGPAPDRAQRADARADRDQGRGDRHRDPRVHARGRRAQPRARARHALPQGRARVRRGQGEAQGDGHARQGARDARPAPLLLGGRGGARSEPGVATGPGVDAGRRRGAVRRGDRVPGHRQADHHRPARRRHEASPRRRRCRSCARTSASCNPDLPEDFFQTHDLHIHVPAGAIPKDGPSAGVTMATALASLISGRPVREDTAMTGELTLTGQVLPIGGLKEKALAAQAAGIKRVIAPKLNEQDIEDIPEHLRKDIEFIFVERIEQVLEQALEPQNGRPQRRPRRAPPARDGAPPPPAARQRTRSPPRKAARTGVRQGRLAK